jgi:hypothetical protein
VASPLGILKFLDSALDPRTWNNVKKGKEAVDRLKWTERPSGVVVPEARSIEEYVQKNKTVPVISSIVDRSKTDAIIDSVNDIPLSRPVNIEGGTDWMFKEKGKLFANQQAIAKRHLDVARAVEKEYGVTPLFATHMMSPSGGDFGAHTAQLAMSHAFERLNPVAKKELDNFIRNRGFDVQKSRLLPNGKKETYIKNYRLPDWYGIDDPRSVQQIINAPADFRKGVVTKLGTKNFFESEGFLSPGELRTMVTQDDLRDIRDSTFTNIGIFDTSGKLGPSGHGSYPIYFPGTGTSPIIEAGKVGILDFDTLLKAGAKDKSGNIPIVPYTKGKKQRVIADPRNPTNDDLTAIGKNISIGELNEAQLDKWKSAGIFGAGAAGAAGVAGAAPPEFLDRIYNPQNHKFIMNDDGTISTHLMAAEMDSDGNWYVFPLIQEDAEGNLNDYRNDFDTAMEKAITSGNFLPFGQNKDAALEFSKNYKQGTPLEDFNPMKPTIKQNMESMINTPRRAEVTPMKRNAALGLIADAFKLGKDVLNDMPSVKALVQSAFGDVGFGAEVVGAPGKEPVKVEGTLPVGDKQLGLAPEGYDNLSYGMMPTDEQLLDMGLLALGPIGQIAKPLNLLRKAR